MDKRAWFLAGCKHRIGLAKGNWTHETACKALPQLGNGGRTSPHASKLRARKPRVAMASIMKEGDTGWGKWRFGWRRREPNHTTEPHRSSTAASTPATEKYDIAEVK